MVIMFGGLHLEMAMWNMMGNYLADSGWTVALSEAGIASSGTVESFLKVSHLTRTRHAHQITIAALSKLQRVATWPHPLNVLGFGKNRTITGHDRNLSRVEIFCHRLKDAHTVFNH